MVLRPGRLKGLFVGRNGEALTTCGLNRVVEYGPVLPAFPGAVGKTASAPFVPYGPDHVREAGGKVFTDEGENGAIRPDAGEPAAVCEFNEAGVAQKKVGLAFKAFDGAFEEGPLFCADLVEGGGPLFEELGDHAGRGVVGPRGVGGKRRFDGAQNAAPFCRRLTGGQSGQQAAGPLAVCKNRDRFVCEAGLETGPGNPGGGGEGVEKFRDRTEKAGPGAVV